MLPKSSRLNLRLQFSKVARGRRTETPHFKLFYLHTPEPSPALVGISMSKKQLNKAHDRNRARRIASQAIENLYHRLPIGLQLVIMPKTAVISRSPQQLQKELEHVKDLHLAN